MTFLIFLKTLLAGVFLLVQIEINLVDAHAKMIEPPMRSSMWRFGYNTPINYNDNELFCGGIQRFLENGGRCGTCGDPYDDPNPEHEAGGRFASGTIVRYYPKRVGRIPVTVDVTAHHKGFFEFRLCVHNDVNSRVSQQCLDKTLLVIEEGEHFGHPNRFFPSENGLWNVTVRIPPEITCTQCVLQMRYKTGNSWGQNQKEADKGPCLGCGPQEEFRNCADISIGYPEPPSTTVAATTGKPNVTSQNQQQQKGHVRNSAQEYQTRTDPKAKRVGKGLKGTASNQSVGQLDLKKRYKQVYKSGKDQLVKFMKSGGNEFNFRVRRIEETLSLLDDTERVLDALETHLDKNSNSSKISGSEYVKLYAGLVWTKRKIRHLESLITKVSSKLSLIRHTNNKITKSKFDKGMRLSEYASKSAATKRKLGSKDNEANADKYVKTVVELRNNAKERPVYRMAAEKERKAAKSDNKRNRINTNIETKTTKAASAVEKTDNAKNTHLVAKFPALNSWRLTTLNTTNSITSRRDGSVKPSLKGTPQVLAPNSMPWSPDTDIKPESPTIHVTRPTRKPKVGQPRLTKKPNFVKTKKMSGRENNARIVQNKDSLYITNGVTTAVTKAPKEINEIDFSTRRRTQNEIFPTLGVLGIVGASSRKKNSITVPKQKDPVTSPKQTSVTASNHKDSVIAKKLSKATPLMSLVAQLKASNTSEVNKLKPNNRAKSLAAKLRALSRAGGPMSKWVLAELKNRILHQQYMRTAALKERNQNKTTVPAEKSNLVR